MLIFTSSSCKCAGAFSSGQRNAHGPVRVSAELFIVTNLVVVVLVLHVLRTVFAFATCHSCPCTMLALAVAQLAKTLVHIVVFLTPGHQGDVCHVADCAVGSIFNSLYGFNYYFTITINLSGITTNNIIGIRCYAISSRLVIALNYVSQILQAGIAAGNSVGYFLGAVDGEAHISSFTINTDVIVHIISVNSTTSTFKVFNLHSIIASKIVAV